MRHHSRRLRLAPLGALTAVLLAGAASSQAHGEARSAMTRFLPPPPAGWESPMAPTETEDETGLEPMVSQGYGPSQIGARGFMSITMTHPSAHDMAVRFPASKPLGPNPMAPQFVTTREKVNGLDAYLIYDREGRGGVLELKVGRVLVGIQGGEVTAEQILGLASSIDTAQLMKY